MARIFARDAFSPADPPRRSSGRSIDPLDLPLASSANTAGEVPISLAFPAHVHPERTRFRTRIHTHTHTHTDACIDPRRFPVFPGSQGRRSPRAQVSRGEDSRRRFPGKSDARRSIASTACEIALGVLFPYPPSDARAISPLRSRNDLSSFCHDDGRSDVTHDAATRDIDRQGSKARGLRKIEKSGWQWREDEGNDGYTLYYITKSFPQSCEEKFRFRAISTFLVTGI